MSEGVEQGAEEADKCAGKVENDSFGTEKGTEVVQNSSVEAEKDTGEVENGFEETVKSAVDVKKGSGEPEKGSTKQCLSDKEREQLASKLDKELEEFISGLEKRTKSEAWSETEWQKEMEKHPFFMTKPPAEGEELSPLLEGIQQLKYDPTENTPEDLAVAYKEDGNFNFKCKNYRMAIISYTEGLRQRCDDMELNAQLLNNRAAAHFYLKNYRSCYNDCRKAIEIKHDYNKCRIKMAQTCFELGWYGDCVSQCDYLLKFFRKDVALMNLRRRAEQTKMIKERDTRRQLVLEAKAELENKKILKVIQERGVKCLGKKDWDLSSKMFPHAFKQGVHLQDNRLVWPVIFMYPEFKTSDFIQEFHEDALFGEQCKEVFATKAPWDISGKYTPKAVRVYFEDEQGNIHNVSKSDTLGHVLSSDSYRVDAGVPVFMVLVRDSEAEKHFLRNVS